MKLFYIVIIFFFCISCVQKSYIDDLSSLPKSFSFKFKGKNSIKIDYIIKYNYDTLHSDSLNVRNDSVYSLSKITIGELRRCADEISYTIASKDSFPIQYLLKDGVNLLFDTVIYYKKIPDYEEILYARLNSNNYAKLTLVTYKHYIRRAKTYLVDNRVQGDSLILDKMAKYLFYLLNGCIVYNTPSDMPVYSKIPDSPELVSTNMDANYFYLLAVRNKNSLESFLKEEMINDFPHSTPNILRGKKDILLKPLDVREGISFLEGFSLLILCGVNNDLTYNSLPLGCMQIDDEPPSLGRGQSDDDPYYSYRNNILGLSNKDYSPEYNYYLQYNIYPIPFEGYNVHVKPLGRSITANIKFLQEGYFDGDNYFGYNIPFICNGSLGDLDEIIINSKKIKVISKNNSIFGFRFKVHFNKLDIGDNYITVDFIDKRGNKKSTTINISMRRIRKNGPSIEINNNISID